MASAKDSLREKVERLSEEEAREVLDLITRREAGHRTPETGKLTREAVRARLAGRPGYRVSPSDTPPFRKRKRLQCPGVPASELLIADRR